jgi:glutamate 5-kinase
VSIFLQNSSISNAISNSNIILIKVGTNVLMDSTQLNKKFLTELVYETSLLMDSKKRVVIVTSGAIGMGKRKIKFQEETTNIKPQQGLAAIGQIYLMDEYKKRFEALGIECGQVLLSQRDFTDSDCVINIKNTFDFLFEQKIVPIVNENDVVATEELRKNGAFSDNDSLSVLLANQLDAKLLVMLTTKNGLIGKDGEIIIELKNKEELMQMEKNSSDGRGGIDSKLKSIFEAQKFGINVFVTGSESFNKFSKGKAIGTFIKAK